MVRGFGWVCGSWSVLLGRAPSVSHSSTPPFSLQLPSLSLTSLRVLGERVFLHCRGCGVVLWGLSFDLCGISRVDSMCNMPVLLTYTSH